MSISGLSDRELRAVTIANQGSLCSDSADWGNEIQWLLSDMYFQVCKIEKRAQMWDRWGFQKRAWNLHQEADNLLKQMKAVENVRTDARSRKVYLF